MKRLLRLTYIMYFLLTRSFYALAQEDCIISSLETQLTQVPIALVDSIKQTPLHQFLICIQDSSLLADTLYFNRNIPDTLVVEYHGDQVYIQNPRFMQLRPSLEGSDVTITARGKQPFVCMAKGACTDGRLLIDSDTTCTLILNGLQLSSKKGSAISFRQKQKAKIELADGTTNSLSDCADYQTDTTDTSNGCLYAKGSLTFTGSGTLGVTGNYRHAISSGKNITMKDGHIIIYNTAKDGLHCDKMQVDGGNISLYLANDASKGIKCKEDFTMTNGRIEGEAYGNVIIEKGETTYCSLLKCGGTMTVKNGTIALIHNGAGGRCISVDGNLHVTGGDFHLENHGHGGSYLIAEQDSDYFTPKCITVNGCAHIERGMLQLLATGNGGKGIDCSDTLFIGRQGEDFIPEDSLLLKVETRGTALVDNVEEDFRKGCPKAVKADTDIEIYSGNLNVQTQGQGGEGIESKQTLHVYKAVMIVDTYDDCFNTGVCCHIDGAHIYCLSHHNDGIDSNGSIIISEGIVASVNESKPNESFDTEDGQLYLLGGTVFGIGSGPVDVKEAAYPCYSTSYDDGEGWMRSRGLILDEGKFVCMRRGEKVLIALRNSKKAFRSFITVMSSAFNDNELLTVSEGDSPEDCHESFFDGKLLLEGNPCHARDVIEVNVLTIQK